MKTLKHLLQHYRIEFFLCTLLLILFGSLIFSNKLFASYLFPCFLLLNISSGINLITKKKLRYFFISLFIVAAGIFGTSLINMKNDDLNYVRFTLYFLFYVVVTLEIIKQIWFSKEVNKEIIIGVISGYISLGLVGFFIFMAIEMTNPGSFQGELLVNNPLEKNTDNLLYYSYITLMTIGYGEIIPTTNIAQKATIFLGLMGQFYLVIITAVVVGKFINNKP